ncbi:hypothetical protein A20C1_10334 [marine actinobacterium PHSC20C1]|nr:hypothetical protein A20C1_10334 [marine actinobacterium PHSC20C1]
MVYEERNKWSALIVTLITTIVYVFVVLKAANGGPLTAVEWWPIMAWTIGVSIVATIVISVLWGIIAGIFDPDGVGTSDQRDRDISRMGDRVGQSFIVIGGLGVIVLSAFDANTFWIANTMFLGFALSAIVGGVASVIAYRRGLV